MAKNFRPVFEIYVVSPPVLMVVLCNLWEFCAMGFDRIPYNPI